MANLSKRGWLKAMLGFTAVAAAAPMAAKAGGEDSEDDMHFPGDPPAHKVVYQLNKAEYEYQEHVLNSVSAMLRKYGDNVGIVIVFIGPGIHLVAKNPTRTVPEIFKQKISSLHQYGVELHACGNTMETLGWTAKDMLDEAVVVDVGAADLMELQEQGYAYVSW